MIFIKSYIIFVINFSYLFECQNEEVWKEKGDLSKLNGTISIEDDVAISPKNNESIKIRKCCDENEYLNLKNNSCLSSDSDNFSLFNFKLFVSSRIMGEVEVVDKGRIKNCSVSAEAPEGIANKTHSTNGDHVLKELLNSTSFKSVNTCLELTGVNESNLTLVYCSVQEVENFTANEAQINSEQVNLTQINSNPTENEAKMNPKQAILDNSKFVVRKCCETTQYYNPEQQDCLPHPEFFFYDLLKSISSNPNSSIKVTSGPDRISECPRGSTEKVLPADSNFIIYEDGILHLTSNITYNRSHYCLELVGINTTDLSFIIKLCSLSIPKCCSYGQYFSEIEFDCIDMTFDKRNGKKLLTEFTTDSNNYGLAPLPYYFMCNSHTTIPVKEDASKLHISEGKLCDHVACYAPDDFCIDYIGQTENDLEPSAFYCQGDYFVKCCEKDHFMTLNGCLSQNSTNNSIFLQEFLDNRIFSTSFNTHMCRKGKGVLLDEKSTNLIWWVGSDGRFLTISYDHKEKHLEKYCIDDFQHPNGEIVPSAYVCESEVAQYLPKDQHFLTYSKKGSLGKCCPKDVSDEYVYYYSLQTRKCESTIYNGTLKIFGTLSQEKFTDEHFHDFPECPNDKVGYHIYYFNSSRPDYAEINNDGVLKIITSDGRCIEKEKTVTDLDYCLEYVEINDGELVPSAFLCAYSGRNEELYFSKFTLITALIGISCFFLLLTFIHLLRVKIKRGFMTIRKVNTLPGRLQLCFVGSHLLGFLALSLTQHDNLLNKKDTIPCFVLAGFVQFFNLATFCWNTSICLESLLLSIIGSKREGIRFVIHSIWAWGTPTIFTLLMYLMNAYRDVLPCWVITPKIGAYFCFYSNHDATLVYFFTPIVLTLVANIVFLVSAKMMRRSIRNKLAKGNPKGGESQQSSGMRVHQNQNLKSESITIVIWTGGTWFMELAGFILRRYVMVARKESWYEYFWYIPIAINALRGVGIFAIIVLNKEKRNDILKSLQSVRSRWSRIISSDSRSSSSRHERRSTSKLPDERKRTMSVTTVISTLSSIYNNSNRTPKSSITSYLSIKLENLRNFNQNSNNTEAVRKNSAAETNLNKSRKNAMTRSISQITSPSKIDVQTDCSKVNIKTSSPLPKLQEEESVLQPES